ncbi:dTMP kinase [Candidatus Solincola tengchongensis]|uniref:dTMP kinase n=1 Tax=Candidatus Solincola tengchongensis TaxID=2900693 RepID=UPI00257F7FB7|nr:dTMP kinase [Candidatus Solincola tengchongensis]
MSHRNASKTPGKRKGVLITFEGVEGSGKTTQMNMLHAHLIRMKVDVVATHEPGGTRLGEEIRRILLDPAFREMHPLTETVLYAADRAQHVYEVIKPALEAGKVVLCDRYLDSSLAYQGVARRVGLEGVRNLNEWVTDDLYPDLTFLLEIPYRVGLKRLEKRKETLDRMEAQPESFHEQVQEAYRTLAKFFPYRYVVLNGADKPENIHHRVMEEVMKLIG